ncbi:MAG: hypothetical protein HY231_15225, partial [Acidobacteria bacterium]|nr:hypothetical protein [Acidobacteriota bacterium]
MLESIGSLLGVLHAQKGKELRLEVGKRASLHTANGVFEISQAPLSQADIGSAIMPLIPEPSRRLLPTQPEVGFNYECNGVGSFAVTIKRLPSGIFVSFAPQANGSAASSDNYAPTPTVATALRPPAASPRPASPTGNLSSASASTSPAASPASSGVAQASATARYAPAPTHSPLAFTIDELFRAQVAMGASDLHLSVSMPPMVRKDGIMKVLDESHAPLDAEATTQLLMPIIPQTNRDEFSQRN